ncbi:hypothetical protein C8R46DRAFT_1361899 [Mycena filopes]|nr:hypothetical protein C8R46DRAFT_1361899 [Mycena filopes]
MTENFFASIWQNNRDPAAQTQGARSQRETHTITCGAKVICSRQLEISSTYPARAPAPYIVPILPLPLDEKSLSGEVDATTITGCGTKIHSTAVSGGRRIWIAPADCVLPTVVPLSADYFTAQQKRHLGGVPRAEECGCRAEGVGCCICGNTLGIRRTYCPAHERPTGTNTTSYLFLAESVSPPLLRRSRKHLIPIADETPATSGTTTTTNTTPDPAPVPAVNRFADWFTETVDRHRQRAPSPTQSELEGIGRQQDADDAAQDLERATASARFYASVGVSAGRSSGEEGSQAFQPGGTTRFAR